MAVGALLVVVALVVLLAASMASSAPRSGRANASQGKRSGGEAAVHRQPTISPLKRIPPGAPSDQRRLSLLRTISGHISPKSVDASDTGLVFAQNMMYTHTVTVYNSGGSLVKTIPDTVEMARFGFPGHPGITHGAPVEAAFTPGRQVRVRLQLLDVRERLRTRGRATTARPASAEAAGDTDSYVYRINTSTLPIDQVIEVGLVPKFLAVTPNGSTYWSPTGAPTTSAWSTSPPAKQVARLPIGPYPRGIWRSRPIPRPHTSRSWAATDIVKINLTDAPRGGQLRRSVTTRVTS